MTHPVSLFGAAALGIVVASSCAQAQTRSSPRQASGRGRAARSRFAKGVEPWLTLGTWAPVGSRQGYALDTLRPPQRNSIQGTFQGMRGNDRLPNDVSLPQANRPLIVVSWPGASGPCFPGTDEARQQALRALRARDSCGWRARFRRLTFSPRPRSPAIRSPSSSTPKASTTPACRRSRPSSTCPRPSSSSSRGTRSTPRG